METFNAKRFKAVYAEKLAEAMKDHPEEYSYPASDIPKVVEKMTSALAKGDANKDGYAIRRTCTALRIPFTYTGIKDFLQGDFKLIRDPSDNRFFNLVGPDGRVFIDKECHGRLDEILTSIRAGAVGTSEIDEVAAQILESVK